MIYRDILYILGVWIAINTHCFMKCNYTPVTADAGCQDNIIIQYNDNSYASIYTGNII